MLIGEVLIGQEKRKFILEAVAEAERSPDTEGMVLVLYVARKDRPHETHCAATGTLQKMRTVETIAFTLIDAFYGEDDKGGNDA